MKADDLLNKLEVSGIPFVLLRPVQILNSNDVDLWIKRETLPKLVVFLKENTRSIFWKKTNARKSLQIILNNTLVIDIQFSLSFLPYKIFQVDKSIQVTKRLLTFKGDYVYPNLNNYDLFTLWSYRILLDKKKLSNYQSLCLFQEFYSDNIDTLLNTEQFLKITKYLFGNSQTEEIQSDLKRIVGGELLEVHYKYAKQLFKEHKLLYIIKVIFETKYKIERRLGIYNKKRKIELLER
ncbi:MAG: hypothetical protein ACPGU5_04620 [Lishizhenia sp.]